MNVRCRKIVSQNLSSGRMNLRTPEQKYSRTCTGPISKDSMLINLTKSAENCYYYDHYLQDVKCGKLCVKGLLTKVATRPACC